MGSKEDMIDDHRYGDHTTAEEYTPRSPSSTLPDNMMDSFPPQPPPSTVKLGAGRPRPRSGATDQLGMRGLDALVEQNGPPSTPPSQPGPPSANDQNRQQPFSSLGSLYRISVAIRCSNSNSNRRNPCNSSANRSTNSSIITTIITTLSITSITNTTNTTSIASITSTINTISLSSTNQTTNNRLNRLRRRVTGDTILAIPVIQTTGTTCTTGCKTTPMTLPFILTPTSNLPGLTPPSPLVSFPFISTR
jgi:hypothetical protein